MATHSSVLAWKTPGTEEPGGPQSMGRNKHFMASSLFYTTETYVTVNQLHFNTN